MNANLKELTGGFRSKQAYQLVNFLFGERWEVGRHVSDNKRVIGHPEKLQGKTELNRLTRKRAERSRT